MRGVKGNRKQKAKKMKNRHPALAKSFLGSRD